MGVIVHQDWRALPLFVEAKRHIADVASVLDIGAGLRPQSLVNAAEVTCMEPHDEYADALEAAGFRVIRAAAPAALNFSINRVDTVVMLDVIEHMEKADGVEALRRACLIARRQVIVFTPLGFLPQSGGEEADAWGLQGQQWQRHRSGWTPEDFPDWLHLVDEHFAPAHPAFFAIWTRPQ
jgi:hypothetical protein